MTPDIDEIRQALAAEIGDPDWFQRRKVLHANAPVWLAQLCDEIERLNAVIVEYEATMQALNDIDDEWADS